MRAAMLIDILPLWCVALPLAALFGLGLRWGIFWVYVGVFMEQAAKLGAGSAASVPGDGSSTSQWRGEMKKEIECARPVNCTEVEACKKKSKMI